MGGEPEWVAEESRPLYHAALAIGANHLVTLVTQSMDLLRASGVQAPDRMLGPLLGAALDNALRSGDSALTGPVARGDAGTVAAHVAELRRARPADRRRIPRDGPRHRRPGAGTRSPQARTGRGPARRLAAGTPRRAGRRGGRGDRDAPTAGDQARATREPAHRDCSRAARSSPPRRWRTSPHTGERAVVMTMGALHDGPRLARSAPRVERVGAAGRSSSPSSSTRSSSAPGRTWTAIRARWTPTSCVADEAGADVVFAPSGDEVYPERRAAGAGRRRGRWAGARGRRAGPGTSTGCSPSSPSCSTSRRPDVALLRRRRTLSSSRSSAGWCTT